MTNTPGYGSSDPKAALMNQVRQEAAMTNARQLIEVFTNYTHLPIGTGVFLMRV